MGGSNAKRRIMCPGSRELEQEAPSEGAISEYALRGLMLHAAMQLLITADPADMQAADPLLAELVGQDFKFQHILTTELVEEKLRPALAAWFQVRDAYELKDWIIEERVSLESILPGAYGYSDLLAIDVRKALHTFDWKFGDGVFVYAKENYALGFYAAGALYDEDPEMQELFEPVENDVYLHIVQPAIGRSQVLDTWKTDIAWINGLVDLIEATAGQTHLKAGDWCQFCKAASFCPALAAFVGSAVAQSPQAMGAMQLSQALGMIDTLDVWIAAVKKLALDEMQAGAAIPGYKLVSKQPRRIWSDPVAAEKILRKKHKVGQIFKRELISPTQAEKLNKSLYKSKLADIVAMHSSGTTIVPDDDRRQSLSGATELLAAALPKL